MTSLTLDLGEGKERAYDVRLVFCEPRLPSGAGRRVFNVALQGRVFLTNLDVAREAGGADTLLVKEASGVRVTRELDITLTPARAGGMPPVLSGVEVELSRR